MRLESQETHRADDDRCLTPTGFLLRLAIYSSVVTATLLPAFSKNRSFSLNLFDGAAKAKQYEGRSFVSAINRSQQAYYLETGRFANSIDELGIDLPLETNNYRFQIWLAPKNGPFQSLNGSVFDGGVIVTATAKSPNLKSYTGRVEIDRQASQLISGICGTVNPSQIPPLFPTVSKINEKSRSIVNCPKGSKPF